jgi:MHS family alpha-ketoglutarate permease-like MFS transporter
MSISEGIMSGGTAMPAGANDSEIVDDRITPQQRKVMVAATLGTIVEWTDWLVYTTFASVIAQHFFPSKDPLTSLLATLAVFAVGFVARPIGGAVLGAYADRHGRKKGLTLAIVLMAAASFVIGITPTYAEIGIFAPLILVLARLVQGFSAGGEFGSASAFLAEAAPPSKRAFFASWQWFAINAGVLLSMILGFATVSMTNAAELSDWGWRVGFIAAAALGLVTLWIRRAVAESGLFEEAKAADAGAPRRNPVRVVLLDRPKIALRVIGISMAGNLLNYIWMVNYPNHALALAGVPLRDGLAAAIIAILVSLPLIPYVAKLSDRFGRRPVLLFFSVGSMLWAYPSFALLQPGLTMMQLAGLQTIAMVLLTGYAAASAATMAEQFPAAVRVTGIGLPYAISVTLFGGTAPYIATWLGGSGNGGFVWLYIVLICLVSTFTYFTMRETKGVTLQ